MTKPRSRSITGQVEVDGIALRWSVRSEPQWNTTDGDVGLRLSIVMDDDALTRHGQPKAWRELILQYPFVKRQKTASRFPDKPRVDPIHLVKDIKLAMEAGWNPRSRGRPFELILEEKDMAGRNGG